jgi:hypothetical protein
VEESRRLREGADDPPDTRDGRDGIVLEGEEQARDPVPGASEDGDDSREGVGQGLPARRRMNEEPEKPRHAVPQARFQGQGSSSYSGMFRVPTRASSDLE